jgi:hypothetical protein
MNTLHHADGYLLPGQSRPALSRPDRQGWCSYWICWNRCFLLAVHQQVIAITQHQETD